MDFNMDNLEKRFGTRPGSFEAPADQPLPKAPMVAAAAKPALPDPVAKPEGSGSFGLEAKPAENNPVFNPVHVGQLPPPTTREQANTPAGGAPSSFAKLDMSGILDIVPPSANAPGMAPQASNAPSASKPFTGFPSPPTSSAPAVPSGNSSLQPGSSTMAPQQRNLPFGAISMGATPGNPARPPNVPMGIGQAGAAARRAQLGGASPQPGKVKDEFDDFFDGPAKGKQARPTGLAPAMPTSGAGPGLLGGAPPPPPPPQGLAPPPHSQPSAPPAYGPPGGRPSFPYSPQVQMSGPPGPPASSGFAVPGFAPPPGMGAPPAGGGSGAGAGGGDGVGYVSVSDTLDASARLSSRLNAGPSQAPTRKAAPNVPGIFVALGILIFLIAGVLYMGDIEEINFKLKQMYSPSAGYIEKAEIQQAHLVGHSIHELSADGVSPVVEPKLEDPSGVLEDVSKVEQDTVRACGEDYPCPPPDSEGEKVADVSEEKEETEEKDAALATGQEENQVEEEELEEAEDETNVDVEPGVTEEAIEAQEDAAAMAQKKAAKRAKRGRMLLLDLDDSAEKALQPSDETLLANEKCKKLASERCRE